MAWHILRKRKTSLQCTPATPPSLSRHAVETHLHQKQLIQGHRLSQLRQHQLHQLLPATLLEGLPEEECRCL